MINLAHVLRTHGPAFEADLEQHFSRDLADLYTGELTVRKAGVLLTGLPRGSNTWIRMGGPGAITAETEGLWLVEHAVKLTVWDGKGKPPQMRDYPEEWGKADKKTQHAVSQAEKWRARAKARREGN